MSTIHIITVTFFYVFYVFFENPNNVTFYVFFALLHTFSRTMLTPALPALSGRYTVHTLFRLGPDDIHSRNGSFAWHATPCVAFHYELTFNWPVGKPTQYTFRAKLDSLDLSPFCHVHFT